MKSTKRPIIEPVAGVAADAGNTLSRRTGEGREEVGFTTEAQRHRGFAALFGVSVHTLRNRDQGRRTPEGPARALLKVIEQEPEAALRALAAA